MSSPDDSTKLAVDPAESPLSVSEQPETPDQIVSKVASTTEDTHTLLEAASVQLNLRPALDKLRGCETIQEFFDTLRDEATNLINEHPDAKVALKDFGEIPHDENDQLFTALKINDFAELKGNEQLYDLGLTLANVKNDLVTDLTREALQENGTRLGLSEGNQKLILNGLTMAKPIDHIYDRWRKELYPPALLAELEAINDPNAESKKELQQEHLMELGLDDPYAIVKINADGSYASVPYALAFPDEYKQLIKTVDLTMTDVNTYFIDNPDLQQSMRDYLNAYKDALSCNVSAKDDNDEWKSVKLWKIVDEKWIKTPGPIEILHGIETGYSEKDPASIKVIPELKIVIDTTSSETRKEINTIKQENLRVLKALLDKENVPDEQKTEIIRTMNVGLESKAFMIAVCGIGGASKDYMGVGIQAPNYDDVADEYGIKIFMGRDERKELRESAVKSTLGVDWKSDNKMHRRLLLGHEVNHPLMGCNVPLIEELKATFTLFAGINEGMHAGTVSREEALSIMKENILYIMIYLGEIREDKAHTDYETEGIATMKLTLQTGLITKASDGTKYEFHEDKLEAMYKIMTEKWVEFVKLYSDPERENENTTAHTKYSEFLNNLIGKDEFADEIDQIAQMAREGMANKE